jgi:two-component system, LytTR family, sensor kinase
MDDQKLYNIFTQRSSWYWQLLYWLFAALLMFFIFSNRNYDFQIRIILVSLLIVASYFITLIINDYLIPKYLFNAKFFLFTYILFAVIIVTLWIISISVFLILIYSAFTLPNAIVPQRDDIVILIAGNYLIVILAAVIHFIKESYRRLIEKNDIEKKKQLTELKLKEANLKLLQGQIHPHFLFNMLNNLYGLVKENTDSSRDVIMKLSELLDYMLYECDKPIVSLKNEIKFIGNYIELERIRHDESFNVKFSFSESTNDIGIAPLILFPFVENAFKHGFHDPETSFIIIDLDVVGNKLKFKIENSISDNKKDRYLNQEGKGIGHRNSKERLELVYKDMFQLNMSDDQNIYKVDLEIDLN